MLTIEIIEKDIKYTKNNQLYYKNRSRFTTITDINIISNYEVKSDRIEIEEIQKLINGNYNYQYYIKPIKRLFEMEVISYSKWVTMWLRDKKLKQLLDE